MYTSIKNLSTTFPQIDNRIPLGEFDMLPEMARNGTKKAKKIKGKNSVTEFQKRLAQLVDESGLDKSEIERRSAERNWRIPVSTLNDVLSNSTNPGVKTIEGIALAIDRSPLSVLALALDEPPDEEGFQNSLIAVVWNLYKQLPEEVQQHFDRYVLKPAIEQMRERLREVS